MGEILGLCCEKLIGHRFPAWTPMTIPGVALLQFEEAQCRWCRQRYVRGQRLEDLLKDA